MTSAFFIGLVLAVAPSCRTTSVVRHPKFSSEVQYGFIGQSSWRPSYTTSVYGLPTLLNIIIEDLPDKNDFQMNIEIKCKPSENTSELHYILPFRLAGETLCESVFPFKITNRLSVWQKADQQKKYQVLLLIERDEDWIENRAGLTFEEAFSHHVRIKFTFNDTKWRLESNTIYLWSFDSALKRRDRPMLGRSRVQNFLSSEALSLMLNLDLPGANSSVQTIPFFKPGLISLFSNASQYVRSYANVKAFVALTENRSPDCQDIKADSYLPFSTLNSALTKKHEMMLKVAQVNANGSLTFSRYGLSKAMKQLRAEHGRIKNSTLSQLSICVGLELLSTHSPNIRSFRHVELKDDKTLNNKTHGSQHDNCQIRDDSNRKVTLFERSGINRLICPIICSNNEEPYLFYRKKGTERAYGNMIDIQWDLTSEDAGEYWCTAGNKTAKFDVSVVSLPNFMMRIHDGETLVGSLPTKIYAMEGEGYYVKCTVYFTGVQTPTLVPEFNVMSDGRWVKYSIDAFLAAAKSDTPGSYVNLSESNDTSSKTFELTVKGVSDVKQLFDHRLLCKGAATRADAALYGLEDYGLQSGSDVHFVQRPRNSSFKTFVSDCCFKPSCNARTENCSVEIYLKKEIIDFLTNIGVKVNVTLMQGRAQLRLLDDSYDPKLAKVTIKATGSLSSMSDLPFLDIRPVFRYLDVSNTFNQGSFTVLRGNKTNAANDEACYENSKCLFSTEFDHQLSERLTLSSIIRNQISSTSETFPTTTTSGTFPTATTSGTFPTTTTSEALPGNTVSGTSPTTTTSETLPTTAASGIFPTTKTAEDSSCLRAMPLTVIALAVACTSATFLLDGL